MQEEKNCFFGLHFQKKPSKKNSALINLPFLEIVDLSNYFLSKEKASKLERF
jgi:hypothetical protein